MVCIGNILDSIFWALTPQRSQGSSQLRLSFKSLIVVSFIGPHTGATHCFKKNYTPDEKKSNESLIPCVGAVIHSSLCCVNALFSSLSMGLRPDPPQSTYCTEPQTTLRPAVVVAVLGLGPRWPSHPALVDASQQVRTSPPPALGQRFCAFLGSGETTKQPFCAAFLGHSLFRPRALL